MPNKRVCPPIPDDELEQHTNRNKRICTVANTRSTFPKQSEFGNGATSANTGHATFSQVSSGKRRREIMTFETTTGLDDVNNKRSRKSATMLRQHDAGTAVTDFDAHARASNNSGTGVMDLDVQASTSNAPAAHAVSSSHEWNSASPLWVVPYKPRAVSNSNDNWQSTTATTTALSSNFARSERRLTDHSLSALGEHQLIVWEPKAKVIRRGFLKEEEQCIEEEEDDVAMCDT